MDTEKLRKLKALQAENARLKKLLADKSLDFDILKDSCERLKNGAARAAVGPTTPQVVQIVHQVVWQGKTALWGLCRVVGRRRATIYTKPKRSNADKQIGELLKKLSMKYLN